MGSKGKLKERVFVKFVKEVLLRKAISSEKYAIFDYKEIIKGKNDILIEIDVLFEAGFEQYQGPIGLMIKPRSLSREAVSGFCERIKNVSRLKKSTIIFIVNEYSDIAEEHENVKIWDLKVIYRWIKQYPIEYYNTSNFEAKSERSSSDNQISDLIYDEKKLLEVKEAYIQGLHLEAQNDSPLCLVLGAGVSIEQGAKKWDDLLSDLKSKAQLNGLVDDSSKLSEKVGGSSLTTAQLCRDVFKSEVDFLWEVHQEIYPVKGFAIKKGSELGAVAQLANRYQHLRNFRIITYNYDDYLERYLNDAGVKYNILTCVKDEYTNGKTKTDLYEMRGKPSNLINIYYVHGYLPHVPNKSSLRGSICLTEADYNLLYNQPYSWPIVSQMMIFRENICLFVGCSLTDPNIRRLLELACVDGRWHYALLCKDGLSMRDLSQVTLHFYRLGVKIIWIDIFSEIAPILNRI